MTLDPVSWPQAAVRIVLIVVIGMVIVAAITEWGKHR